MLLAYQTVSAFSMLLLYQVLPASTSTLTLLTLCLQLHDLLSHFISTQLGDYSIVPITFALCILAR
jgi:hypothetical protein